MVINNYNEPNKATLATWVDEALDVALSKKNQEWVLDYRK
jgi:hypothetical protein